MTLKTSLVLSGDSKEAVSALMAADKALAAVDQSSQRLAKAQAAATREIANARAALKAGEIGIEEYNRSLISTKGALSLIEGAHRQAMNELRTTGAVASTSTRQAQAGYVNLGRQVQDVAVQLQSGTNIGTIIAQQGGQVADAVSQMGGRFSGLAAFMSGPWGAAITVGIGVLFNLAQSLWNAGDAADQSGSALSRLSDKLDLSKNSYKSLMAVVEEYNAKQKESTALTYQAIAAAEKEAQAVLDTAKAKLAAVQADLTKDPNAARFGGGARLHGALEAIRKAEIDANSAGIAGAGERAKLATDQRYAISTAYEVEADRWREKAKKQLVDQATLERVLVRLINEKGHALERYDAAHKKASKPRSTSSGLSGREINLSEATSIAKQAHFDITSGFRTRAEQQWLYDHKRTKENPVALPGTSAHEKGNALDIAFGKGVTPASLRKAFADEGVRLTKVLKESGHFHIEWSTKGADKIAREAEQIDNFGARASESIARINSQFDEQPRLVDQAASATRELDRIISDLKDKQPIDWRKLVAEAQGAKATIQEALVRPFAELRQESERRLQIQALLSSGRDEEAAALQTIWQLEQRIGPLTAERKREVLDTVRQERAVTEELQRRQEVMGLYLDASRQVRQELTAILSGQGSLKNLGQVFKNLSGQILAEKLFGSAFRDLDAWIKGQSGLAPAVDTLAQETGRAGKAAGDLADTFNAAMASLNSNSAGAISGSEAGSNLAGGDDWQRFLDEFDSTIGGIVVNATRPSTNTMNGLSPERYFDEMTKRLTKPLLEGLNSLFGVSFFEKFQAVLSGALNGFVTGGVPGGILGALKGIKGIPEGISKVLGKGLKGTQTGTAVAGIGNALGIKMSTTGAQIGGMIGSLLPIPGGEIIGSIAGGLLGGLFGKRPRGASEVSNNSNTPHTNDSQLTSSLGDWGSQIQSTIQQIADQLGASVGNYSIGLGRYKEYYQVSTKAGDPALGNSYFNQKSANDVYDGTDAQAAMAAAIKAALSQGAVAGISAAMQKALASSADIDKAVAEALKVKEVETLLGGLGAEIKKAFADFEKQAAERLRVAKEYGFDVVKIEERNAQDRLKLTEKLMADQVGSLQQLIEDMTSGSLFEGSAVDQRQALLDKIAGAKAEADAGKEGASDKLAQLLQQLNLVSREAFGTTGGFADDRTAILDAARDTIARANQRITDAKAESDPALAATNAALDENNDQNAEIIAKIDVTNERLGLLLAQFEGGYTDLADMARTSKTGYQ